MGLLQPAALFGLEVPAGVDMIPAAIDFPATIRITMAAIDPTEEIEDDQDKTKIPRSTLKVIRIKNPDLDSEEGDEYLEDLLGDADSDDDDEDDDDDDEPNGGPSDPSKSKRAREEAAIKKLLESVTNDDDSDDEMEEAEALANGTVKSKKGKQPATDDDEDDEEEDDEDDEGLDLDGLEVETFVVCTLDTNQHYQQPLDITILEDEKVFFTVSGTHSVHLTGNYVIDLDEDDEDDYDEDDEDGEYDLPPGIEDLVDMDEDDLSDDLDEVVAERIKEVDTDDDAEIDEEEEVPKAKAKKGKNKRLAEDEADGLDALIAKDAKSAKAAAVDESKLSKKQLKKLKNNKGEAVAVEEPKKETNGTKADKKVQFAKNLEQGPTGSTAVKKDDKAAGKGSVGVKVVQGVTIDDRKVGTGRTAKAGDRVGMRYIGKLQNGKVFDSNKKGAPFAFKLGKGEVIKGWDVGVAGMAIGGERRLTIPANLAYGSKSLPDIPANSTLIFDVKLLEIK